MIDWNQVNNLKSEVGEDAFDEVVEIFLEETDEAIAALRDTSNTQNLGEKVHFLKGSALNLGLVEFANLCSTAEKVAAEGAAETIDVAAILSSYDTSRETLLSQLNTHMAS